MTWGTVRFAQDGYPNSLLICTSNSVWWLQPNSWKVMNNIQVVLEHGSITVNWRQFQECKTSVLCLEKIWNMPYVAKEEECCQKVLLHHDNACPFAVTTTVEAMQQLQFQCLLHPPYSPDLMSSSYPIFGPLKEMLRGHRFTSDDEWCRPGSEFSWKASSVKKWKW